MKANPPRLSIMTTGNPKIQKGLLVGYATVILHLAPHTLSGRNVCPSASQGCIDLCLNLSGQGAILKGHGLLTHDNLLHGMRNTIQDARIRRTRALFADRKGFLSMLIHDMERFAKWCARTGWRCAFRLNGTSDLDWHGIFKNAGHDLDSILRRLGAVAYDYTKVVGRAKRASDVYHLTFSLSESNESQALAWLARGGSVAAVFNVRAKTGRGVGLGAAAPMVDSYMLGGRDFQVVDGDESDLRFRDPGGVIVGLRAKGNAKRTDSAFVRKVAA